MKHDATPSKIKKVYTAAQLLGHTGVTYAKAIQVAERFSEFELDKILRKASEKSWGRKRLTVISNPAKV